MNEDSFWQIIEECFSRGNPDERLEAYVARLEELPHEEVVEFQRVLNSVMVRAYRWDLIGAACFLGCGQSDDGFEDFRAWLISLGRETFENVLADPDLIVTFPYDESPTEEWHCEDLHMTPSEIGGEEDDEEWPYLQDPDSPAGEPVEMTQGVLKKRFPKFWERFGSKFMTGIP
jgi:hypothetical protein